MLDFFHLATSFKWPPFAIIFDYAAAAHIATPDISTPMPIGGRRDFLLDDTINTKYRARVARFSLRRDDAIIKYFLARNTAFDGIITHFRMASLAGCSGYYYIDYYYFAYNVYLSIERI